MYFLEDRIKEILISGHYLTSEELATAVANAGRERLALTDYLARHELVTDDLLGQAIAEAYSVPYVNNVNPALADYSSKRLPKEIAEKYRIILTQETERYFVIATDNPSQPDLTKTDSPVGKLFPGKSITVSYILPTGIDTALLAYQEPLTTRLQKVINNGREVPVAILGELVSDMLVKSADSIHIDPLGDHSRIRMKIQGSFQEIGLLPGEAAGKFIDWLREAAHLLESETEISTGRYNFTSHIPPVTVKVDYARLLSGDKLILRLDTREKSIKSQDLHLPESQIVKLKKCVPELGALTCIVGPVESGRTTFGYALLDAVNEPGANIITVEDAPISVLPGVNQIVLSSDKPESAEETIHAAAKLEPSLVFVDMGRTFFPAATVIEATLSGIPAVMVMHLPSPEAVIPWLLKLNVDPLFLSRTLRVIITVRLVQKICIPCRKSREVSGEEISRHYSFPEWSAKGSLSVYEGVGCAACNQTGFFGRIGIVDILYLTPELVTQWIREPEAFTKGRLQPVERYSMFEDGLEKVKQGLTTLDELARVITTG